MDRERIIVLKKTVYRDSDLIIRGLNSQGAKLSFIAPAALKSRRRFGGGVLEPTNFIEVVYQSSGRSSPTSSASFSSGSVASPPSTIFSSPSTSPSSPSSLGGTLPSASSASPTSSLGATSPFGGPSSWESGSFSGGFASSSVSMPRLQEAQIIKEFQGLRRSYELIQVGLSLLELVDRVSHDGIEHGEELFNLLGHGLQCLTQIEESSLISFRLQFLLKFLFQQGVLEREPWMDLFLRVPLRDHKALGQELERLVEEDGNRDQSDLLLDRLVFIERKIKTYLETGSS